MDTRTFASHLDACLALYTVGVINVEVFRAGVIFAHHQPDNFPYGPLTFGSPALAAWLEPEHGWETEAKRLAGLRQLDFKEIDALKAKLEAVRKAVK